MDHFLHSLRERERGVLTSTHRHLLIFDGHKAFLTLDVITKAKRNGIDILTLPSYTFYGLQPLNVACFKPFKVAFRAYKQVWSVRNPGSKVRKEDLACWISLALKKALTSTTIRVGFRGSGIWPLNFEAMKNQMGPSKQFIPPSDAEIRIDEELHQDIMEEDIPLPSSNVIHYYVDSMEDDDVQCGAKIEEEEPPIQENISSFLQLLQEVITTRRTMGGVPMDVVISISATLGEEDQ